MPAQVRVNLKTPTNTLDKDMTLPIKIGSMATCGLRLEGAGVSRLHALIDQDPDTHALTVRDLSSGTGTMLDGQRVQHGVLKPDSIMRIGEYTLMVNLLPETATISPMAETPPAPVPTPDRSRSPPTGGAERRRPR